MNLDNLTHTSGEWLRGTGPGVRHRHFQPHPPGPQPGRLPVHQPRQRPPEGRDRGPAARPHRQARTRPAARLHHPAGLSTLDRQFLVERQLISRELATAEGPRGVALGRRRPSA